MNEIRQLEEEQERRNEKALYKLRARVLAAVMVPTWFPEYDPAIHHLDHKFSVSSGYPCSTKYPVTTPSNWPLPLALTFEPMVGTGNLLLLHLAFGSVSFCSYRQPFGQYCQAPM